MPKFVKGEPRPANAGRRKGTPNKVTERARRLISAADDKKIVDRVVTSAKLGRRRSAPHLFPLSTSGAARSETYITPIGYIAPKTVAEARDVILALGERLETRSVATLWSETLPPVAEFPGYLVAAVS